MSNIFNSPAKPFYNSAISMGLAPIPLASEGIAMNVTSGAFVKKHSLPSPSSLQTALKALVDKSIVMRTEQGYRLEDFFFAEWLRKGSIWTPR